MSKWLCTLGLVIVGLLVFAPAGSAEVHHRIGVGAHYWRTVDDVDVETNHRALDCYVTYKETIEQSGIKRLLTPQAVFEIYQEAYDPPLNNLSGQNTYVFVKSEAALTASGVFRPDRGVRLPHLVSGK